jgi:membrane-bound lytic murein transglycosylase D
MFSNVQESGKFKEASREGRLRFQLGQKDRFLEGIFHSGRYLKQMEEIFKEQGLPIELTRLPFVESSFNLNARSKVGASGIWQFMRSTGRQYMKIDMVVDERNDPIRATVAAAKKMKQNFNMLGNWPLAVTGYNHGPYGVSRLVKKMGTDNLVELLDVRKGSFGFASASFYASFLAAIEAEKRAEKYFGVVFREKPMTVKKLDLEKNIHSSQLIEIFNKDEQLAKKMNPHLQSYFWRGNVHLKKGHYFNVPTAEYETLLARYNALSDKKVVAIEAQGTVYKVNSGDTLGRIAMEFKVSLRKLMDVNGIMDPRSVQIGQELRIPD